MTKKMTIYIIAVIVLLVIIFAILLVAPIRKCSTTFNTVTKNLDGGCYYIWQKNYWHIDRKISDSDVVEIRDFSCSGMDGFTFKYPVFKGWGVLDIKKVGLDECIIFLSSEELEMRHINTEITPQIKINKISIVPDYFKEVSLNNIPMNKTKLGYDFLTGDGVVRVEVYAVLEEYGFDKESFFKTVTESFIVEK